MRLIIDIPDGYLKKGETSKQLVTKSIYLIRTIRKQVKKGKYTKLILEDDSGKYCEMKNFEKIL